MWLKLRGAKDVSGASNKSKADFDDKTEDDMPLTYFFMGCFAFILFGPQGICHKRLSCLSENGEGVELAGRKKQRTDNANKKAKEQAAGEGGHVPACCVRGVGLQEKASAAQMAQFEASEKTRNKVGLLAIATQEGINLQREFDRVEKALREAWERQDDRFLNNNDALPSQEEDVEIEELRKWKLKVLKRLNDNADRKEKLEKETEELVEAAPKKQVVAFHQQVGLFNEDESGEKNNATPKEVGGEGEHSVNVSCLGDDRENDENDDDYDDEGEQNDDDDDDSASQIKTGMMLQMITMTITSTIDHFNGLYLTSI